MTLNTLDKYGNAFHNIQIEALSNKDDLMSDDVQAQFDYLLREIEKTTVELEDLIKQIQ